MLRIIIFFILIILMVIIQIGFLPGFEIGINRIVNLPLLLLVVSILFFDCEIIVAAGLMAGLMADIYSYLFFGLFMFIFLIITFVIYFFQYKILPAKNLLAFWLINLLAVLIWHVIYLIAVFVSVKFSYVDFGLLLVDHYWLSVIYQLIAHSAIVILIYKLSAKVRHHLSSTVIHGS